MMDGLLIFDHLNDIVFTKFSQKFNHLLQKFAETQGLLEQSGAEFQVTNDIIIQVFAPIVTSHRIMNCQFGNSYNSIKCENNSTMCFNEYMGYLFIILGDNQFFLEKCINVCVVIVRYLCGPDVYQLKTNIDKSKLANQLINNWIHMQNNDQAMLVEAVEQLVINSDISGSAIGVLRESVDSMNIQNESLKVHALILVKNKLFCLYSSQNVKELSSTDILFLTVLLHQDKSGEFNEENISSYQILLSGPERQPKCLPYIIQKMSLFKGVYLVYFFEIGNPAVSASIYETFCHLHTMQQVQIQRDNETLQIAFENLDIAMRRLNDSLKKNKNVSVDHSYKQLTKKWDVIKKKYHEYLKNGSSESLLRAETLSLGFLENLKELFNITSTNDAILKSTTQAVKKVRVIVKEKLQTFEEFLRTKSIKNFSLGSYLEEFPGLIHFLYVDRTTHRVTTPLVSFSSEEDGFMKNKIWSMINFARKNVSTGILSLMWKDTSFNYAYFLWFEDYSGSPLKPVCFTNTNLPQPGIFCENFYERLKEIAFPKMSSNKIKCYELFCIHLGLVTASCVLEQTRRLSASVWELRGIQSHAIDFL